MILTIKANKDIFFISKTNLLRFNYYFYLYSGVSLWPHHPITSRDASSAMRGGRRWLSALAASRPARLSFSAVAGVMKRRCNHNVYYKSQNFTINSWMIQYASNVMSRIHTQLTMVMPYTKTKLKTMENLLRARLLNTEQASCKNCRKYLYYIRVRTVVGE